MLQLQLIHDELVDKKRQAADLRRSYNDALKQIPEYVEIGISMTKLRDKRKAVEQSCKQSFTSELEKLDDLRIDIASQQELLSDAALSKFMKGEEIEIKDEFENKYVPVFSVKFKKE